VDLIIGKKDVKWIFYKTFDNQGTMVSNFKLEVDKFDGTNNFGMWQCEVMDVLVQQN
jgi:hypothetical protein